jgi:hypothetical protein
MTKSQCENAVPGCNTRPETVLEIVPLVHDNEVELRQCAANSSREVVLEYFFAAAKVQGCLREPRHFLSQLIAHPSPASFLNIVTKSQAERTQAQKEVSL